MGKMFLLVALWWRGRWDRGVILGILVYMSDGTDRNGDSIDDLNAEKEGDAKDEGNGDEKGKSNIIVVKSPFHNDNLDARSEEIWEESAQGGVGQENNGQVARATAMPM